MQIPGYMAIGRHTHSRTLGIDFPGLSYPITCQGYGTTIPLLRVFRNQHGMAMVHHFLAQRIGGFEFCGAQPTLRIQTIKRHVWHPPLILAVGNYVVGLGTNN